MNLILHHFKFDLRHFKWLLGLSLLGLIIPSSHPVLQQSLYGLAILTGAVAVGQLVLADRFHTSNAFWKTRPLSRRGLLLSKSLFLIGALVVPVVLAFALRCHWAGLTWPQTARAILVGLPYLLAAVVGLAALASLCRQRSEFLLGLAGCFVLFNVAAVLTNAIQRAVLPSALMPSFELSDRISALIAALVVILLVSLLVWIFTTRPRGNKLGAAMMALTFLLAGMILSIWRHGFLDPKPLVQMPVKVRTLTPDAPALLTNEQLLWNRLAITHDEGHQWAVPSSVLPKTAVDQTFLDPSGRGLGQPLATGAWEALVRFYPESTIWRRNDRIGRHFPNIKGRQDTAVSLTHYKFVRAQMPLANGGEARLPGDGSIRLKSLATEDNVVKLEVLRIRPNMIVSGHWDSEQTGFHGRLGASHVYVIHHAPSNTAITLNPMSSTNLRFSAFPKPTLRNSQNLHFNIPPLQQALLGVDLEEWLGAATLDIFVARPIHTSNCTLRGKHFNVPTNDVVPPQNADIIEPLRTGALADEVAPYLDKVFTTYPNPGARAETRDQFEAYLEALGPEHLGQLIDRMPTHSSADSYVYRVLKGLMETRHLPQMKTLLERDSVAITLFLKQAWQDDALPIIRKRLKDRAALPHMGGADILKLAATHATPEWHEDLRWHFLHMPTGQRNAAAALIECQGFDSVSVILERWKWSRLSTNSFDETLAPYAARFGNTEGLRITLARMDGPDQLSKHDRKMMIEQLRAAFDFDGNDDAFVAWLLENWQQVTWDPQAQRYE